jgi:hypothetical protein
VYRFFDRRAAAGGWRPTAAGALGFTDRWAKTYADGASATLFLAVLSGPQAVSPRVYRLSGGIAPVAG